MTSLTCVGVSPNIGQVILNHSTKPDQLCWLLPLLFVGSVSDLQPLIQSQRTITDEVTMVKSNTRQVTHTHSLQPTCTC